GQKRSGKCQDKDHACAELQKIHGEPSLSIRFPIRLSPRKRNRPLRHKYALIIDVIRRWHRDASSAVAKNRRPAVTKYVQSCALAIVLMAAATPAFAHVKWF